MSAHLRRRGRHRTPRSGLRQVFTLPPAGSLAPAVLGLALTAGVVGSPPGTEPHLEPVARIHVATPNTPLGMPERIEGWAPYAPQTRCKPSVQPGVWAFRTLVLSTYPDTGSDGVIRACNVGGRSEHKEGRAWDWDISPGSPRQLAEGRAFMRWLLATDEEGNRAAMARRLGVMYVIWNGKIWGSYKAAEGWRPYGGAESHRDHVHFSFTWAGALKKTSYWRATGWGHIARADLKRYSHSMLYRGSRGAAVRVVQKALGVRPASGVFGARTRAAVLRFQKSHRLPADGVIGPKTWRAFTPPTAPPPAKRKPHTPAPQAVPVRRPSSAQVAHHAAHVLRIGARGSAVDAIQRIVRVQPDGAFGPRTAGAVARWQRAHRLLPDGVVGPQTWRTAVTVVRRLEAHDRAVALARARARAHALAVARERRLHAVIARYDDSVLRIGAEGPAVRLVQQRLRVRADGRFGPRTYAAVVQLQRRQHLAADGVVGHRTWGALR